MKNKSNRIIALDLMRGYFMIVILLDHLNFYPSGFDFLSARGIMYVTAAEGFFFISGLVLGIVRGQKLIKQPFKIVAKKLLGRGLKLYITSIVLTALFTLLAWAFFMNNPGLKTGVLPTDISPLEAIWKIVTFQYVYGWTDYLYLYSLFLFASPIVMWLLRRGKWWLVLLASFVIWLLFPSTKEISDSARMAFQPLAWQLLFFGGMTIGFNIERIRSWWRKLTTVWRQKIFWIIVISAGATLILNSLLVIFMQDYFHGGFHDAVKNIQGELYGDFFVKERLPLPRVALFMLWFTAGFMIVRKYEKQIIKLFGWLLLPFGMNSLYSYILSAIILFFVHLYIAPTNIFLNFLVSAGSIALIWLAIRTKFLMKIIPR